VSWQNSPGTLAGDADALHDMRVAIRRLRSALQNFEGEKEAPFVAPHIWREMNDWRKELGRLGDSLGAVRDHDVLGDYVNTYGKKVLLASIEESSGLGEFLRHLHEERAEAFVKMEKRINKAARPEKIKEEFGRFALGLPAASGPNPPMKLALETIMPQRRAEVLSHAHSLESAEDEYGQHELRKSLKRLRYTLEFFAPCFDKPVKARVKQITQLQDTLGEMQDRSVLQIALRGAFDLSKNAGEDAFPPDVQDFVTYGHTRRAQLLHQARTQWEKLHDEFVRV
jgi:CHAD domain-containing protein